MPRTLILFISLFAIISLYACNPLEKKTDNVKRDVFYTDKGGFDRPRIPLIKPYELVKVSSSEWRMELLSTDLLALSVHNIKGVSIDSSRIFLYSEGGTEVRNNQYNKAWFIVDATTGKEKAILGYQDFYSEVTSLGLSQILLHSPDSVYRAFNSSGIIEWDNNKSN